MDNKTIEIRKKIELEEDYVYAPKHSFSLKKLMANNEDGFENKDIAKYLMISEEEVDSIYQSAITKIRQILDEE